LKTGCGAVFVAKAGWRGATKGNTPRGSSTEEQRSETALAAKTLRAAFLLALDFVVADGTARCGDVPSAPPRPKPKSPAAAPFPVFKQALRIPKGFRPPAQGREAALGQRLEWVPPLQQGCGAVWLRREEQDPWAKAQGARRQRRKATDADLLIDGLRGTEAERAEQEFGAPEQVPMRPRHSAVGRFILKPPACSRTLSLARAHGMWTYEPRQGRKAATVVCSVSAVVTLAFSILIYDGRLTIARQSQSITTARLAAS